MYGAGAKRLAITAGYPENQGAKIKKVFYKEHPGIKELVDDLENAYSRKGWIRGIDGRPLYVRSAMKLLNTLMQNTATIIFKVWMVLLEDKRYTHGMHKVVHQIIAYHDELQYEVEGSEDVAEKWKKICEEASLEVGTSLGILVPIASEGKVGKSWEDCH